jgi:SAM-dependent methyltransferase
MDELAVNSATGKRLLALIREGDYAHPGEEEADRLLFSGLAPDPTRRVLDAGCGSGGTAAWVQAQGLGAVTGLELDPETARLARERHPRVTVVEGDLQRAAEALHGPFDLTYSMTVLYAVPDKEAAFSQLAALAAPRSELRLLEYADLQESDQPPLTGRESLSWWRPLRPQDIRGQLAASGWHITEQRDLSPLFHRWYVELCARIAGKREAIVREFGADWYQFVLAEYESVLDLVRGGRLGGVLVRASRDDTFA